MKKIEEYIKPSQKQLQAALTKQFGNNAANVKGKYLLVKGTAPVLLVAHMDTVHIDRVKTICYSEDGNVLMSPQGIGGDDRCGIYGICKVYEQAKEKPWLLFTCDEEIGCIGACAFADDFMAGKIDPMIQQVKLIIELDRKGKNDAVFYDCDNDQFRQYILSKGFIEQIGSYSDIVEIGEAMGIASVNLSSGYYNAHTTSEYIVLNDLETTIKKVIGIVQESLQDKIPQYADVRLYGNYDYDTDWTNYDDNLTVLDSNLKPVNERYAQEYRELSLEYSKEEIDGYRELYGDEILWQLYEEYLDGFDDSAEETEDAMLFASK